MKENEIWSCLALIAGLVGFTILGVIYGGFALSVLWGWFVVPVFHLPQLSIIQAIGLHMVVSFLVKSHKVDKKAEFSDSMTDLIASSIVTPTFALLFGLIVLQFM